MTGSDQNPEQFLAVLQVTDEQKEAARRLLNVVQQIEELETAIRAMTAPQRSAVMRYWIEPYLQHGLNVGSYRRRRARIRPITENLSHASPRCANASPAEDAAGGEVRDRLGGASRDHPSSRPKFAGSRVLLLRGSLTLISIWFLYKLRRFVISSTAAVK